ncbi:MAG: glutamate 5-kinase [Pacificimonas sp.]|jgi:glutamate 5-kinase|nr:glutamate 5-kinase [Pacificimonas sp.]
MMEDRPNFLAGVKRLVVKVGSALLVSEDGEPERYWMASLIDDIARLKREEQIETLIVASGAVALGAQLLDVPPRDKRSLEDSQAAAAAGQIALSALFAELFRAQRLRAAQILVTLDDLQGRRRYLNASATMDRLLALGATPIINENDSVTSESIKFGDNDRLAARVAQAANADMVLLLSNVDGLYASDPNAEKGAPFIPVVDDVNRLGAHLGSSTGHGTGGMAAKVEAARIAGASGIPLVIASGVSPNPLMRYRDSGRGTLFKPGDDVSARKAWIAGKMDIGGRLTIDAGAVKALRDGNSLLAAGVVVVDGEFLQGATVDILAETGEPVARGLVGYTADDTRAIAGLRIEEQGARLGYAPRSALVHRNNLVLL